MQAPAVEERDVEADRTVGKGTFTELRQLGLVCGKSHFVQGQVDRGAGEKAGANGAAECPTEGEQVGMGWAGIEIGGRSIDAGCGIGGSH